MSRRERLSVAERSEHWMRVAAHEHAGAFNSLVSGLFRWSGADRIEWLSPIASDDYAEYFDQDFLNRLGVLDLKVPLNELWPSGGPRWDGLAKTDSGKIILVEAKAYIEEAVDYRSKAGTASLHKIKASLQSAKVAFDAAEDAPWDAPFYQYANRLAHLYFLRQAQWP